MIKGGVGKNKFKIWIWRVVVILSKCLSFFPYLPPLPTHPPFPVIHVDLTAPKAFLRIFAEKEVFPSG